MPDSGADVQIYPATSDRWSDLVRVLGPDGAVGGCWCMYWRFSEGEYRDNNDFSVWRALSPAQKRKNKLALRRLVDANAVPGLLAYVRGEPVGWCSIAPRASYVRLQSTRHLGPIHGEAVWSIVCFFIHPAHRGRKVATALLEGAVRFASARGATAVEGYPRRSPVADAGSAYPGTVSMFRAVGFAEASHPAWPRVVMRRELVPTVG